MWTNGDIRVELDRSARATRCHAGNWWKVRLAQGVTVWVVAEIGDDGRMPFPGTGPQYIKDGLRITPEALVRFLNGGEWHVGTDLD
jgi:hypothetical protein